MQKEKLQSVNFALGCTGERKNRAMEGAASVAHAYMLSSDQIPFYDGASVAQRRDEGRKVNLNLRSSHPTVYTTETMDKFTNGAISIRKSTQQ